MMLKPSIDKLLDKVPSRYSLVILQAKRKFARLKVIQARLAAEEEERKIKEQIAKEKEEGDKI